MAAPRAVERRSSCHCARPVSPARIAPGVGERAAADNRRCRRLRAGSGENGASGPFRRYCAIRQTDALSNRGCPPRHDDSRPRVTSCPPPAHLCAMRDLAPQEARTGRHHPSKHAASAGWPSVRANATPGAEAASRAAKPPKGTLDTAEHCGLIKTRRPSCDRSIRFERSALACPAPMPVRAISRAPIDATRRGRAHV